MNPVLLTRPLGKLRVFITPGENARPTRWARRVFPLPAYRHLILEARAEGLLNATVYSTRFGYTNRQPIQANSLEAGNARLAVCLELIDERQKLEAFFLRHQDLFRGKVAVFEEVSLWEVE